MDPIHFWQPVAAATGDVCAAFQRKALTLPRNWRKRYPKSKKEDEVDRLCANTVLKWSRALQAAFERANGTSGKKCVRGVVAPGKLLNANPWKQFTWIEGTQRPILQYDDAELLSFLDYLDAKWPGVTVAGTLAKVCLWSQGRRTEVASLTWSALRQVGNEHHFAIVGKAGVDKWFRVPEGLYRELVVLKTGSPYVFAAYNDQLRRFYQAGKRPAFTKMVGDDFKPVCVSDWFYERMVAWSKGLPTGHATAHIFGKTSL